VNAGELMHWILHIKQTADFGPPPMADDDEDNITSSRAPHVNSVHL